MGKLSMMRAIRLLAACSLLVSCGVPRPNTDVCIVNGPNLNRKCYNLAADYNDDGTLKKGAVATYRPNKTVQDLSKAMVIDSPTGFEDGLAELKTYIKRLRDHLASCQGTNVDP